MVLLYGTIQLTIFAARHLPVSPARRGANCFRSTVCCGAGRAALGACNPYVCLQLGHARRFYTDIVTGTHNPVWNQPGEVYVADDVECLRIRVKNAQVIGSDDLGEAVIPAAEVLQGHIEGWLPLLDASGREIESSFGGQTAAIHVAVKYIPINEQAKQGPDSRSNGGRSVSSSDCGDRCNGSIWQVPRSFFPLRSGNSVTLYHDAVAPSPGPVEGLLLAGGQPYVDNSCWDDLYRDIQQAKQFIFIVGWSVWVETRLLRGEGASGGQVSPTLGELLKQKANEGVTVLLLLWDDRTSKAGLPGVMGIHDEHTKRYFRGTKVKVQLVSRNRARLGGSMFQRLSIGVGFTHHQKAVVMDAPPAISSRMAPGSKEANRSTAAAPGGVAGTGASQQQQQQQQQQQHYHHAASAPAGAAIETSRPPTATTYPTNSAASGHGNTQKAGAAADHATFTHPGDDRAGAAAATSTTPAAGSGGPGGSQSSSVVAFLGGLDLTDGRYDTPQHQLYTNLDQGAPHAEDFYNPSLPGAEAGKHPREPWHDCHARLQGPAAYDVLLNTVTRWLRQAKKNNLHHIRRLKHHKGLQLPRYLKKLLEKEKQATQHLQVNLQQLREGPEQHLTRCSSSSSSSSSDSSSGSSTMGGAPGGPSQEDPESWCVQVVRSIDSDSAVGFPTDGSAAHQAGLFRSEGRTVDNSYHRAAVHLIRSAKHFLYIESQYLLGSAQLWDEYQHAPCHNLVPAEVALKVASKIKAGEPFRAYLVIPLLPEGDPTAGSSQEVLNFQRITVAMIYRIVAEAVSAAGLEGKAHPQDYLAIFCLGNREPARQQAHPDGGGGESSKEPSNAQEAVASSRRFMIYVHSKLMIADDEVLLLGSANINQRSLDGTRDSEIGIAAYQPGHRVSSERLPRGQVSGFRRALWKEHIQAVHPEHDDPSSSDCMASLRELASTNWDAFADADPNKTLPHGHLMSYPYRVGWDGKVQPLPGCSDFPDLGGSVMGEAKGIMPDMLTT